MAVDRMIIWRGISQLDGKTPIIVLATGIPRNGKGRSSLNSKTGDMIQTIIVEDDGLAPHTVLKEGRDESICGVCPHRSKASGGTGACYVNVGQGPRSTWVSHQDKGSIPFDVERFRGHKVRFGTYGDPAAAPFEVWESIAKVADGLTGYTHQWRTADPRFAEYFMASADSPQERQDARDKGYRAFHVRAIGTPKLPGEITCPASAEAKAARKQAGKPDREVTCAECLQCSGTYTGRTADITIMAHGPAKNLFAPA